MTTPLGGGRGWAPTTTSISDAGAPWGTRVRKSQVSSILCSASSSTLPPDRQGQITRKHLLLVNCAATYLPPVCLVSARPPLTSAPLGRRLEAGTPLYVIFYVQVDSMVGKEASSDRSGRNTRVKTLEAILLAPM